MIYEDELDEYGVINQAIYTCANIIRESSLRFGIPVIRDPKASLVIMKAIEC